MMVETKTKADAMKAFCLCPEDEFGLWVCWRGFALEEGWLLTIFGSTWITYGLNNQVIWIIWLEQSGLNIKPPGSYG